MKIILIIFAALLPITSFAQTGYVKTLGNDTIFHGYIRSFHDYEGSGYEIWKTKQDKHPRRFYKKDLVEYMYKKDTFHVIHNFIPFPYGDLELEYAEPKIFERGKINIYVIQDWAAGALIINRKAMKNFGDMVLLEDSKTHDLRGLPANPEMLRETLLLFFTESFLQRFEAEKEKIEYKTINHLISFYNSDGKADLKKLPELGLKKGTTNFSPFKPPVITPTFH